MSNKLRRKSNRGTHEILKDNLTEKESIAELIKQTRATFPKGTRPIMCKCEKCGGIGFAQDETMLDENGYTKDSVCPCGGRVRKIQGLPPMRAID